MEMLLSNAIFQKQFLLGPYFTTFLFLLDKQLVSLS